MLSTRLAPEGTADTHVKVTNYGGSISTTFNNAGDSKTTASKGDVEQGNIEECERVNGMQTRLLLRLLFLGCTVQVRKDKDFHADRGGFADICTIS